MKKIMPGGLGPTSSPTLGRTSFITALFVAFFLGGMSAAAPARGDSSVLQSRIAAAAEMLERERRFATLSRQQRHETLQFVVGNLVFVLLHEVGHVLITELGLPVLGREEDAADAYASVTILAMKDEFSDRVLSQAAQGWFYGDRRDRMELTPVVYYDAHSLSQQRAYQIVCYMVGSDPEKFAALAEETGLPEERRSTCQGDFSNADWSWNLVLKDHRRTTQPKQEIRVRYGEPAAGFEVLARATQSIQLLELIAQRISDTYALRKPFTIEARACGTPGAEWNLEARTLILCYEMAEDFATLYSYYGSNRRVAQHSIVSSAPE